MRRKYNILILLVMIVCFLALAEEALSGVVMKTLVVNPSKTKTQTARLKAYLPKEVTPEDIIDIGDLKIDYDIGKGLYYVHQRYKLKPGQSVTREIEINDVWVISKESIEALVRQAKELAEKLKDTPYYDMALKLQQEIEDKTEDIMKKQEEAMDAKPQTHIGAYRINVKTLDSANDSLDKLEKMIIEAKEEDEGKPDRIHVQATWRLIIAMVVALGVLSFIFFIIWNRQAAIEASKNKSEQV